MSGIEFYFKEYFVRLSTYACSFVDSEEVAKDLVQDAFVVLMNRPDIICQADQVVKSFLYSTIKNQSLNHLRRLQLGDKVSSKLQHETENHDDYLTNLIQAEIVGTLHKQMASLPLKCQHICKLIYFDGKKYEEVAKLLNISLNTVKSQRQRALRLLRGKLLQISIMFLLAFHVAV